MCLKPSKSRNSTATCFSWRCAKAIAWPTRSFRSIGQTCQKIVLGRMRYLRRHGSGRAHVTENDDRSRDLAFEVMDGRNAVLDRHFKSVAADQDAVQWQVHHSV